MFICMYSKGKSILLKGYKIHFFLLLNQSNDKITGLHEKNLFQCPTWPYLDWWTNSLKKIHVKIQNEISIWCFVITSTSSSKIKILVLHQFYLFRINVLSIKHSFLIDFCLMATPFYEIIFIIKKIDFII